MKLSKKKQFGIVLAAFLILGIPFKVMILVERFTEVRPVNAIPPLAGLICGPLGALACGIGNFISDFFGTLNSASGIGLISNMLGAYLPYRLWHIYSHEAPNVHSIQNILKYIGICYTVALVVAWSLGFGMYYCLGQWMEEMYTYVFFNNFGFSIVLGLPLLILLTSQDVQIECAKAPSETMFLKNAKFRQIFFIFYTILMSVFLILVVFFQMSPVGQPLFMILSLGGLLGLFFAFC